MKIALLCYQPRLQYFIEYLLSLQPEFTAQGIECELITELSDIEKICRSQISLILQDFAEVDALTLYDRGQKIFLINTEQLSHNSKRDRIALTAIEGIELIDYNIINLKLAMIQGWYIPYQYREAEIAKLRSFLAQPKKYDVVFCGAPSKRRLRILSALKKRGFSILIVSAWGDERDRLIAQGKVLLNIHCKKSFLIYESLRCDRWLFAGMPVVSENVPLVDEIDVAPLMFLCEYNKLVETVAMVLENYPSCQEKSREIIPEIIEQRKEYLKTFVQYLN